MTFVTVAVEEASGVACLTELSLEVIIDEDCVFEFFERGLELYVFE